MLGAGRPLGDPCDELLLLCADGPALGWRRYDRRVRRNLRLVLIMLAGVLANAAVSHAAVSITGRLVVVSSRGAVAMVSRDRFQLRISTRAGRPALSEVPNRHPAPAVLPRTLDPLPPGTNAPRSGQLYAPLTFLVGRESTSQYSGLIWGGDLMSGVRSGVQYSARKVIRVRRRGPGVSITVATDDPSGRKLQVVITPAGSGLIRVSVTPHPVTGVAMMSDSFSSPRSEAFYGFGGVHDALDQRGRALSNFVEEENLPRLGVAGTPSAVLYPNGPTAAYDPQAQFVSSRGYGFLLAQPQLAWFRLDSDRPDAWSVAASAPSLTYVIAPGRAIAALTALTGRQPAPPAWALGPMLDRLVKNGGETQSDYVSGLDQDVANIDRYHLPLSAYRIEGWGFRNADNDGLALHSFVSFATQAKIVVELRARHIHPLAYLRPWITPGSAPDREGLTVRTASGQTSLTTSTTGQPIALLDFTNPAAVRFWQREVAKVFSLGFDGFMADFGEEVLDNMHFADGQTGKTMHNRYPILYMRATRKAIDAYERSHSRRELWFFNRAGYSGAPGSAEYEGGNFPGDESTDWGHAAGLASLAPDMLNRAIGGAYGYGTDIGGYFDYTTPPTTKELFLRWAEWAALSPILRLHGSGRVGTHTPWSYDQQTVSAYRALSQLHQQAAPLILRLWREADRTGVPPTRPLWLAFPGDRRAAVQQQEWMLGGDVLVAPVVNPGATSRGVYFPAGCWRDPQTGLTERGPRSKTVSAPLTRLPYFFRCRTNPFRGFASSEGEPGNLPARLP
jgi:alpha-glucosidase (family GH31 glycosyl hydrolase)